MFVLYAHNEYIDYLKNEQHHLIDIVTFTICDKDFLLNSEHTVIK